MQVSTPEQAITYASLINQIFGFIKQDKDLIHNLANQTDEKRSWGNPDLSTTGVSYGDINSQDTLAGLAALYKRLKSGNGVRRVVFEAIILKMLWIASDRREVRQVA